MRDNMQDLVEEQSYSTLIKDVLIIVFLFGILYSVLSVIRPFSYPDLARYIEIPREMVQFNHFITPRVNGVTDFSQPPFYFWLQSFAYKFFGLNIFSFRLWSVVFALFGCIGVYGATRHLFSRRAGLIAASILASSGLYFIYSQTVGPYIVGSVIFTLASLSFLRCMLSIPDKVVKFYCLCFWFFTGLSVLIIGPIALIGLVIINLLWMAILSDWAATENLFKPLGILVFLIVTVPWFCLAQINNPDFLHYYFIELHWGAILQHLEWIHKPVIAVFPGLFLAFLPWSIFLINAIWVGTPKTWEARFNHGISIYLYIWASVIFIGIFFASPLQLPWLVMILPPCAIITGRYLDLIWERIPRGFNNASYELLFVIVLLALCILVGSLYYRWFPSPTKVVPYIQFITIVLLTCTLIATPLIRYQKFPVAFYALFVSTLLCLTALTISYPHLTYRKVRPLTEIIKTELTQDDVIVSYNQYFEDLPIHLQREIMVVDWKDEPDYGKHYQALISWVLDKQKFWQQWHENKHRYFVFLSKTDYAELKTEKHENIYYIDETPENVVLSNRPFTANIG